MENMSCMKKSPSHPSVPNGDWRPNNRKKRGRRESRGNHLFLSRHKRGAGGTEGIMEARKPDRQGRPASWLASSLPRFISFCHVAAWLGLLMSVCVLVCPVCVCSDVGRTREDGGGHIGQSRLHTVYCVNAIAAITHCSRAGCDVECCIGLAYWPTGRIPILPTASSAARSALFSSLLSFVYILSHFSL